MPLKPCDGHSEHCFHDLCDNVNNTNCNHGHQGHTKLCVNPKTKCCQCGVIINITRKITIEVKHD